MVTSLDVSAVAGHHAMPAAFFIFIVLNLTKAAFPYLYEEYSDCITVP